MLILSKNEKKFSHAKLSVFTVCVSKQILMHTDNGRYKSYKQTNRQNLPPYIHELLPPCDAERREKVGALYGAVSGLLAVISRAYPQFLSPVPRTHAHILAPHGHICLCSYVPVMTLSLPTGSTTGGCAFSALSPTPCWEEIGRGGGGGGRLGAPRGF